MDEEVLAAGCLANLRRAAVNLVVQREITHEHKRGREAVVPVLTLGSEGDMRALWRTVAALDARQVEASFSPDDLEDVRCLEWALDEICQEIIECFKNAVAEEFPGIGLSGGLVDGWWAIYARIPRGVAFAALKTVPAQMELWG